MPEIKSAATKNFSIYWDETNRTLTITSTTSGYMSIITRAEAGALAKLLASMAEYDD